MGASNWVHINVESILRETSAAFLVELEDGTQLWIPKSQMADPDDYKEGMGDCVISITEWLAKEKGINTPT